LLLHHLSLVDLGVFLGKEFVEDKAQAFLGRVLIRLHHCPSLETFEGMLKDSRKLNCKWSLPMPRDALTATFEREETMRLGSNWRVLPERCRMARSSRVRGRSHHRLAPFEDRPFRGVLIRLNLHHLFAFLKGGWSRSRLDGGKGNRNDGSGRCGGRRGGGRDGSGRSRGTRGPRHPLATSKGVSKPRPFFLVQHHTCAEVKMQEVSKVIQNTRVNIQA